MGVMDPAWLSADEPQIIAGAISRRKQRVLLFGEMGIGKSTLTRHLAAALEDGGHPCVCLGADPGSPDFGVPGAVCIGRWKNNGWQVLSRAALCSLNAGRFRLPLVQAVKQLVKELNDEILLVDAPGITRGIAGAELLLGLTDAALIQRILVLCQKDADLPYPDELTSAQVKIQRVVPSINARRPNRRNRMINRTALWDDFLIDAKEMRIDLSHVSLTGTPPPFNATAQWHGRQVALMNQQATLAMGEVVRMENKTLTIRSCGAEKGFNQVIIRDACRDTEGYLKTARHAASAESRCFSPFQSKTDTMKTNPMPFVRMGGLTATLMNGVFGDPLVHLRIMNLKQSLLFDLGSGERLPSRIAHQLTHVFITHAHMDHIAGFLWLLRARIGDFPCCNIYGPPGIAGHIQGMINGIHWDRIGENGPHFCVHEVYGDHMEKFGLQAGKNKTEPLGQEPVFDHVLLETPEFRIRAVELDHGIPVLAFSFEEMPRLNIQKTRLSELNIAPGPWIGELKHMIAKGNRDAMIRLPDNTCLTAGKLADDLLTVRPARKMVYATDLADTASNRDKLILFAQNAHTFFCEAAFTLKHEKKARSASHLTARACGEIAQAANVEQVIPFHFSKRYEHGPQEIYDEVRSVCTRLVSLC